MSDQEKYREEVDRELAKLGPLSIRNCIDCGREFKVFVITSPCFCEECLDNRVIVLPCIPHESHQWYNKDGELKCSICGVSRLRKVSRRSCKNVKRIAGNQHDGK